MASLYVAYNAANKDGDLVNGWVTMTNTAEPQSTVEIKALCGKIAENHAAEIHGVVPIWWRAIPRD